MAEDLTRVLDKIKKLMALSTSSNPNEAANAAAKAQALLEQYNLDLSLVETSGQENVYLKMEVRLGTTRMWRRILLAVIAGSHFCEVITFNGTDQACVIGQAHNSQVVIYLYGYLAQQLERMAVSAYQLSWSDTPAVTWKDAFYMGAIQSINARLQTQHQTFSASSEASRALVVVKDEALKQAVQHFFPQARNARPKRTRSVDGYFQGVQAGNEVSLHQAIK